MSGGPLLEVVALRHSYPARGLSGRGRRVVAIDDVSFSVAEGESLGIVGGSGAGKSTLVKLLLVLERPERGLVRFAGHEISAMSQAQVRPLRRRFQPVFQDPLASLDPRMRVAAAVAEPLEANGIGTVADRRRRVAELLDQVGLAAEMGRRYPEALSGGERQRVAVARALAPKPELLILDEPLSSLDVTVQVQILDLLAEIRRNLGLTLVMVTHDLSLVRLICDRVVVMLNGRVVEEGTVESVFDAPNHQYTKQLLDAVPKMQILDS